MKTLISFLLLTLILGTFACNGDSTKGQGSNVVVNRSLKVKYAEGMVFRIGDPVPPLPAWIQKLDSVEMIDGEKHFCVVVRAESANDIEAERAAKGHALGELAEGVRVTVMKAFGEASESYGTAGEEQTERVRKSLIATNARVNLQSTRQIARFTDQVAKIKKIEGDKLELGNAYFICYMKVGIPYDTYKRLRNGYLKSAKKRMRKPSKKEKRLLREVKSTLKTLDRSNSFEFTAEDERKYIGDEGDVPVHYAPEA